MDVLEFNYNFNGLELDCEAQYTISQTGDKDVFGLDVRNFDIEGVHIRSEKQRVSPDGRGVMKYDAIMRSSKFDELRGELDISVSLKQNFYSLKKILYDHAYDILKD